jgi:hypothetical protein
MSIALPEVNAVDQLAAVGALLVVVGLVVAAWLIWPTKQRIREAAAAAEERRRATAIIAAATAPVVEDIPAGPNYSSGAWPVVEPRHAAAEEPVEFELPAEPVEVEPEQPAGPWWAQPVGAIGDEPTPLFNTGRPYPEYDVEELSATNAWNRADLLASIRAAEFDQARGEQAA